MNKIPNSDIIGYEGPVGHEKSIHKNVFLMPGVKLKSTKLSKYKWIEVGAGRWKMVKKEEGEQ